MQAVALKVPIFHMPVRPSPEASRAAFKIYVCIGGAREFVARCIKHVNGRMVAPANLW
jgi:hypothetical protein